MSLRICPECDLKTQATHCPRCGTKTFIAQRGTNDPYIGKIFEGRYRIEALIGKGGMGCVYRAVQTAMDKVVAIKLIQGERASDPNTIKRFHREAKAASLLSHPHTIKVFDFGQTEDGDLYMVMEYLEGKSLTKLLQMEGRLSVFRALKIAGDVAQSLAEAHALGIAHRDLKPDNIMLLEVFGDRDFVKVLDFGVAKILRGDSSDEFDVTQDGAMVGTPHYMAPEQARCEKHITPAVDIYALGVILYQMLAGIRPFDGPSTVSVLMSHVNEPVPELPLDCPASPNLRQLVRRMLSKNPKDRPSATELIEAFYVLRMSEDKTEEALKTGIFSAPQNRNTERTGDTPTPKPFRLSTTTTQHGKNRIFLYFLFPALASMVIMGGGLLFWFNTRGQDTNQQFNVEELTEVEDEVIEIVLPEILENTVSVRFRCNVFGAHIFDGDKEIGVTPLAIELPAWEGKKTFVVRMEGYQDAKVEVDDAGGEIEIELKKAETDSGKKKEQKEQKIKGGKQIEHERYERLEL